MRCRTPGLHPDEFSQRLHHGGAPGQCGQFVLYDLRGDSVEDPYTAIKDLLGSALSLYWGAGDGNAPRWWRGAANAANVLTLAGAPTAGNTPWQTSLGVAIPIEDHTGASCRTRNADTYDPPAGQDAAHIIIGRRDRNPAGTGRYISTRTGTQGMEIYDGASGSIGVLVGTAGGFIAPSVGATQDGSLFMALLVYNSAANQAWFWLPGQAVGGPWAVPAGAMTGGGIGLGAFPSGAAKLSDGGIVAAAVAFGVGLSGTLSANSYEVPNEIFRRVFGLRPAQGASPTFARNSVGSMLDASGRAHIVATGIPRASTAGLRFEPAAATNKCGRNINPQNVTALSYTGAKAPTAVSDAAELAAAGLEAWGPAVYEYANDTGSDQYIYNGSVTSDTYYHSCIVAARLAGGAGAVMGLYDPAGAGTWTEGIGPGAHISGAAYGWFLFEDTTPANAAQKPAMLVPDGCTVRWIAHHCERAGLLSQHAPIPVYSGASATAAAETLTGGAVVPATPGHKTRLHDLRNEQTRIWLVAGQSNAVGPSHSNYLPTAYHGLLPLSSVRFALYDVDHAVDATAPGATLDFDHNAALTYGPEIATCLDHRDSGRLVACAKSGQSGSSLAIDWDPAGVLFAKLVTAAQTLKAECHPARYEACVWVQGEADAIDAAQAAAYEANLTAWIAALRADLGFSIHVFVVQLHALFPGAHVAVVRAAQAAVAAAVAGVTLIDIDDLALRDDDTHHTDGTTQGIGHRVAAVAMETPRYLTP